MKWAGLALVIIRAILTVFVRRRTPTKAPINTSDPRKAEMQDSDNG
jgi:hypothetical protein